MIHLTCPCCTVSSPPHQGGCTFHEDFPQEAELFDEVAFLRARVKELEAGTKSQYECLAPKETSQGELVIYDTSGDDYYTAGMVSIGDIVIACARAGVPLAVKVVDRSAITKVTRYDSAGKKVETREVFKR